MKNFGLIGMIVLIAISFTDLIALGGRSGDGGGQGGGHHGSGGVGQLSRQPGVIDRTPSMSRSGYSSGSVVNTGAGSRSLLNPALPNRSTPVGTQNWSKGGPINQANRSGTRVTSSNFNRDYKNRWEGNRNNADRVRDYYKRNRGYYKNWFNNPNSVYWNNNVNWWQPAGWGTVSGWVGYDTGYPVYYYDSEYDEPVELEPDVVNYINVYNNSPPQQQQQPVDPLQNMNVYIPVVGNTATAPTAQPQQDVQGDWLPLGVFAVGRNTNDIEQANMFIQLAINKQGVISGTYYNTSTTVNREISGQLNKQTQEVSWKLSDNPNSAIVTTGLYNLSQPETKVTVTFPNGMSQVWLLVRLQ